MADLSSTQIDENVPEAGNYTKHPDGNYPVVIIYDEIMDNKNKTGKKLYLEFLIFEGIYKGDIIKSSINLINPSAPCQKIGQGELKKLCRLTGLPFPPKSTDPWKGKPIFIKLVEEEYKNDDGETKKRSVVKDYKGYQKQEQIPTQQSPLPSGGAW